MFDALGVATDLGVLVGYQTPGFLLGAELTGKLTIATTLTTTMLARNEYGTTSGGGTLWLPARGLEAGVRGAFMLGRVELSLRLGYDKKGQYNLVVPPWYVTAGLAVRLGRS